MAKKDLLERLSKSPADPSARRMEGGGAEVRADEKVVQTRVNRKVVRRRRRADRGTSHSAAATPVESEEVVAQPATRRRPGAEPTSRRPASTESVADPSATAAPSAEETPVVVDSVEEVTASPEVTSPAPEVAERPVEMSVSDGTDTPTEASQELAPAVANDAAEGVSASEAPEVVADGSVPVVETAPSRDVDTATKPDAKSDEVPAPASRADEASRASMATKLKEDEDGAVPSAPRFHGLGKAVVMPPPGYDPTNPTAWRRQQPSPSSRPTGAGASAAGAKPGTPSAPSTPGTPGNSRGLRGRRRVAAGGDYGRRGAGPARPGGRGRGGGRRDDRSMRRKGRRGSNVPRTPSPKAKAIKRKVKVDNVISVSQLAHEMGIKAPQVIKELMKMGTLVTVNEMLDVDTATLVATEFDYQIENVGFQENAFIPQVSDSDEEDGLISRPPVVTIMGHVDHGKTTLLDAIRDARVAAGEAGGITQHIGAYQVTQGEHTLTFIDTPGHAAFSEMRARGAGVTDVVVLVVAADDGVQPQTREAVSHARAAQVPIVVAVNKMDKPGVNPDNVKTQLSELGLNPEEWGGDTLFAHVSALKREGIDDLLEQILLQSEMLDLRANPERPGEGVVVESKMERGRGPVATVLIQRGTLNLGDHVVIGATHGKVRAMLDYRGKKLKLAGPSTPVEIFGLNDLPQTADVLTVVDSEKNAKTLAEHRAAKKRQEELSRHRRRTAEDLFAQTQGEEIKTLNLVVKADVQGSLEALKGAIEGVDVDGAEVRILHSGVGAISESDVNLVAASEDALLIGFNVKMGPNARTAASAKGVEAETYSVIYDVLDRVNGLLTGMLAPVYEQKRCGSAEVRALFKISRIGTIAGSYVLDGKIVRNSIAKVQRNGEMIWEGKVSSVKRFKDDVREVTAGYECGISLDGFNDLEEGDVVECFQLQKVERV